MALTRLLQQLDPRGLVSGAVLSGAVSFGAVSFGILAPVALAQDTGSADTGGVEPGDDLTDEDTYGACLRVPDLFDEVSAEVGLRGYGNSRGVNLNDFDGDGLIDVYLARAPNRVEEGVTYSGGDRLFRNLGDGSFDEVGQDFGLGDQCEDRAPMFGDLDNDGDPDLYLTVNGANVLYANEDGHYHDVSARSGDAAHIGWGHVGALLDVDRDGYLDIFFTNGPEDGSGPNTLLRNERDGTFFDASEESGVGGVPSGKGACVLDADLDGWPDVFVTTGREYGNHLFMNQGDGSFVDEAVERGVYDPLHRFGVGASCGDVDNDGDPDIYLITHDKTWTGNQLFENLGDGTFIDVAAAAGVDEPVDPHGSALVDVDHDGWLDIVTSGIGLTPQVFRNERDGSFVRLCSGAGLTAGRTLTWAVATGDVDGDAWPDVYIAHGLGRRGIDDAFYRNLGGLHHWLEIEAVGAPDHNPSAIGAKVEVVTGDQTVTRWVGSWSSFDSQGPLPVSVGLAEAQEAELVRVSFTSGAVVELTDVAADQRLVVEEPTGPDDTDLDGVPDAWDRCPETMQHRRTDGEGCAVGQHGGVGIAGTAPAEGDIVIDPPTFSWQADAASEEATTRFVVQVSWDGTFGPAARLDLGPTTASTLTMSAEDWSLLLAEWDGVRPLLWRVAAHRSTADRSSEAISEPVAFYGAVPTSVVRVPRGANVFQPAHVVVDAGEAVTWWNDAVAAGNIQNEMHDVQLFGHHGNALVGMTELNGAGWFRWSFDDAGRYHFTCHRHSGVGTDDAPPVEGGFTHRGAGPYHCMSGTVTVR